MYGGGRHNAGLGICEFDTSELDVSGIERSGDGEYDTGYVWNITHHIEEYYH